MEIIYTERDINEKKNPDRSDQSIPSHPKRNKCLIAFFVILGIGVVATVIFLIVHLSSKKHKSKLDDKEAPSDQAEADTTEGKGDEESKPSPGEEEPKPIQVEPKEELPLEKEFEILTKVGLRKLKVVQNSIEENKISGNVITTKVKRITNYDIYILKEEKANNKTKKYFNSTYSGAIAISSECFDSNGEDCNPQRLVDLSQETKNKNNKTRILTNAEELKDIPIALCLFNITDNNFILSMSCPESFPDTKKNEINLDLYFFRPPAIKRADKEHDGINVSIKDDLENKKRFIRETNEGTCNVQNNIGTKCRRGFYGQIQKMSALRTQLDFNRRRTL